MIRLTEVDGIPAVVARTGGPTHAGLVFRVGIADEPLARRGITHLVEHLVLGRPSAGHHRNGATGVEHTYFHTQGTADEITAFLEGVCAVLRDPPADRIAEAAEALHAESAGRGRDRLPMWRYGARDFGMASYPEWGLDRITGEDLHDWIGRFFTRENAALWVAGDGPAEGLRLDLRSGVRQAPPAPSAAPPGAPAWFAGDSDMVGWDTVVRREARAAVFANVLERQMFRDLRLRGGISDQVRTEYEPRAAGSARITAYADSLPGRREAVLGGMVDVLAGMRAGRIDDEDVATVVGLTCDGLKHAESRGGRLPGQAFNLLAGRGVQGIGEVLAEVRAVTAADVAEVAADAYREGLLMTPEGTAADWAGYAAAPVSSGPVVSGRAYRGRKDRALRLIHGDEGVSVITGDATATVRYDTCAALLAWPDGGRHLVGEDAIVAKVEPTLFRGAEEVVRDLDQRFPGALRVVMPARDPSAVPAPVAGRPWWRRET
ncbi:insulinase family protein [Actinoplanes sp. NBRC 101535]|uniref:insulinase family protein n=1 Tax=Actinoplanes sp. NBRC 101535 TaxID=3032196 RepID=UPI0024A49B92|nr:insulinase family protein [Actinoplanes sp. NBRC 101535]GLY00900.1 hypothetical protein Acsp01_12790 [Actinoplanes sp. NBRC 101535]